MNVPSSANTLVISYVGMITQEVAVASTVNVSLESSALALDEVVITGYGTFKKSSFTGSASSVTTDRLMDIPSVSVQDRLAGAVSGVTITSTSGQPGAVEKVRIRGLGSINATQEPLYVIDGVPVQVGDANIFTYAQSGNSILSTLNSNDIESMTVIKDAAAASLYGSRAANGVIIITTKRGSAGKTKFGFRADWGFSDMAINYRPTLNGPDRRNVLYLGLKNYSLNNGDSEADAISFADRNIDSFAAEPWSGWTDWQDILFRKGSFQTYEANAQGGNDKTNFYSSLSYTSQDGITLSSAYERYTGRINVTHRADRITLEASALFSKSEQGTDSEGTSFSSPIMAIKMSASPSTYPYNEDGTFSTYFPAMPGANPLASATYNYSLNTLHRSLTTMGATWNIWENLNLKEVISYDFIQSNNRVWWDPRSNDGSSYSGNYQRYMTNRQQFNTQTQLTYNKTIADQHNLDFLLGFETEDYKRDYTRATGQQYPGYLPEITNSGTQTATSYNERSRMASYLGRINYDYLSRYYLGASFRRDGSSRLSRDSRWGNFWSVSGAWRISEESFMNDYSDIISDAKLRASYGVNGTQPLEYYEYMALYKYGYRYDGNSGSMEATLGNENLKWEKNYATNIGLDLTFLSRFSMTLEWYTRDTKDLIMEKPISGTVGVINADGNARRLVNVGSMRNRGIELELKSNNVQNKNLTWTTGFTLGHNKNKLLVLDGDQSQMITETYLIHREGNPYYSFYAYEYAGVDPATGKESFYINKEGQEREITTNSAEAEKVLIGSAEPKVTGGLTNFIQWKFIDFNMTWTYSLGGKTYDRGTWMQTNGGTYHYNGNVPAYYKPEDMWHQPGDHAKLPQFAYGNTNVASSRWMFSTDHLRLKNITIGFTMPRQWSNKAGFDKLRAYISGSNLLTWKSKDLYLYPEVPADGLSRFETPQLKTVTFGIELGF